MIILFDGDDTGWQKSKKVYESIKDYVPTKRILLPIKKRKEEQYDPGNMPEKFINILKEKIHSFTRTT